MPTSPGCQALPISTRQLFSTKSRTSSMGMADEPGLYEYYHELPRKTARKVAELVLEGED
ncbi:hypothetical protein ACFLUZ_02030 [Chloroflexota bacterium]